MGDLKLNHKPNLRINNFYLGIRHNYNDKKIFLDQLESTFLYKVINFINILLYLKYQIIDFRSKVLKIPLNLSN